MGTKKPSDADVSLSDADPRFFRVAAAFASTKGFRLMESASGATRGLMYNDKSFGMSSHGRFVLKLGAERVQALIDEGSGVAFSPSEGRVMKDWIVVTTPDDTWVALAQEALALARAAPLSKKNV